MPAPPPLLRRLTDWFSRPSWEEYLDQRREAARLRSENNRLRQVIAFGPCPHSPDGHEVGWLPGMHDVLGCLRCGRGVAELLVKRKFDETIAWKPEEQS